MIDNKNSFNGTMDKMRAYGAYGTEKGWTYDNTDFHTKVDIQDNITYRFYPHFHPYVADLMRRLNTESISGLEFADTDYLKNSSDGTYQIIPDSTRARLSANTTATALDNTPMSLLGGEALTLPDATALTIPKSTKVTYLDQTKGSLSADAPAALPGAIPLSFSSGVQFSIAGGPVILDNDTLVTLPGTPQVYLTDGTPVTLPANTQVLIRSGMPMPVLWKQIFTPQIYEPNTPVVVEPFPVQDLDFTSSGAYALYNWELFFHIPLMVAIHLSQNQKFQDAQDWFHYIFDPTDNSTGPTPARFWKVRPFQYTDVESIQQIVMNLSTGQDSQLFQDTYESIQNWQANPFQPYAVGKYRPTAYMFKTVMAYLDNLIAWGDSLFQQYTIETINEATQIYILAANLLGKKPQVVPQKETGTPQTYNTLRNNLSPFSDALVDSEVDLPFDAAPSPAPVGGDSGAGILTSIVQSLFFCVPQNDQLLAYWDTVADRLFKIHNSLNIQGVFQKLPLFDPPMDPALLVRAAAAGLDVNAIVNGLNQPLPLVRFRLLVGKAIEICQEVKSLGSNLLSIMEKQDNESLALLRAQHETIILNLAKMVKYSQWQEAIKAREGLEQSLANAGAKYTYYQELLGRTKINVPTLDALDPSGLQSQNFSSSEPTMNLDPIVVPISKSGPSVSDGEITTLNPHEVEELQKLEAARDSQETASGMEALGSVLGLIPQFHVHVQPMGVGATAQFGGVELHAMASALSAVAKLAGEEFSYEAGKTTKIGTYSRRELDWTNQSNIVAGEITQMFKQLRGAQIREAITSQEYQNHLTQIDHSQEIQDFLNNKETNEAFYLWMKGAVKGLYSQAFQLAFETAKKAERALQNELGNPSLSYVQFSYLDGIEGLLAGEKLLLDVKHMEMDYHDLNLREYEMTKHVSLLQVAPMALIQLRATGSCSVTLPEELFDLDCPGHYFRRIRSVAVTVPCVTGPYTGVNLNLTLQNSSIRTSSQVTGKYSDAGNLTTYYGSVQAVVTSSGQSDNGLFESNMHDDRYLPFEYAGAVSQWTLQLPPTTYPQFNYDTITDVILHVRYTAREGGQTLKAAAMTNLASKINAAGTVGSTRLFSIRHEFPTEWAKFTSAQIAPTAWAPLTLNLQPQHYPYWAQNLVSAHGLKSVQFFARTSAADASLTQINIADKADQSNKKDSLGNVTVPGIISGGLSAIAPPPPTVQPGDPGWNQYVLYFDDNKMKDLWMVVTWPGA